MQNRNQLLDFVKSIAAIGVILVHFQFAGAFGKIMCSIGLVGVIVFFLISGYQTYSGDESSCPKILRRYKKNLMLLLTAVLVYLFYTVIEKIARGIFAEWISNFTNPVMWLRIVFLGDFELIHGDPLWFMTALLFAYLIMWVIEKFHLNKIFYFLLPVLLLLRIGMETYTNSFNSIKWLDWHFSGNFLVGALPVMVLGNFIACKKEKFLELKNSFLISGLVVSLVLLFVSVNVKVYGLDISQFFKVTSAFFAFVICIKNPDVSVSEFFQKIGREYSTDIYLYHYLIGTLLLDVFSLFAYPQFVRNWILPICVIVLSVLFSAVKCKIKKADSRT